MKNEFANCRCTFEPTNLSVSAGLSCRDPICLGTPRRPPAPVRDGAGGGLPARVGAGLGGVAGVLGWLEAGGRLEAGGGLDAACRAGPWPVSSSTAATTAPTTI